MTVKSGYSAKSKISQRSRVTKY